MEGSHFERLHPVDLMLTQEQYLIIQHYLPKKYALIEHKNIKKGGVVSSSVKLGPEEVNNISCRPRTFHDIPETSKTPTRYKAVLSASGSKK